MWIVLALIVIVLLFVFPRVTLPLLAVVVVVAAFMVAGHYRERQRQLGDEAAVALSVRYDPAACSAGQPLRVDIDNASGRSIARIDWVFSARRPGYRGELTGPWLQEYRYDGPLDAGAAVQLCFAAPAVDAYAVSREADRPENLELGIRSRRIAFGP